MERMFSYHIVRLYEENGKWYHSIDDKIIKLDESTTNGQFKMELIRELVKRDKPTGVYTLIPLERPDMIYTFITPIFFVRREKKKYLDGFEF